MPSPSLTAFFVQLEVTCVQGGPVALLSQVNGRIEVLVP